MALPIVEQLNEITQKKLCERILSGSTVEVLMQIGSRSYRMFRCCKPFPGEPAVAIIRNSNYPIPIHQNNCPSLAKVRQRHLSPVNWNFNRECRALLEIKMIDEEGVFLRIADTLRANSVRFDIRQITTYPDQSTGKTRISTVVSSREELEQLNALILSISAVLRVKVLALMQIPSTG